MKSSPQSRLFPHRTPDCPSVPPLVVELQGILLTPSMRTPFFHSVMSRPNPRLTANRMERNRVAPKSAKAGG